jgi:protein dithiol oxidoreductase (disulfide-forming)
MRSFDPSTRALLKSAVMLAAGSLSGVAFGQKSAYSEGTDYIAVKPPQPTDSGGKIEVIEFFWLGCPHCYALEPVLKDWLKRLPGDAAFRKVHVPFNEVRHQQLYYTLDTLGKYDALGDKVFAGIHVERDRLDSPDKMVAYLGKFGVDKKAFMDAFDSFTVQTKMRKATAMAAAYKVDSVPLLAVNGKYMTGPSMAGSNASALSVVDYLIDLERKAGK